MSQKIKRSKKDKIERAKRICELYSEGIYTIASCCKVNNVNYQTFKQWSQPGLTEEDIERGNYRRGLVHDVHLMYTRALEQSKVNYRSLLKKAAREGLLQRAMGIRYTETIVQVKMSSKAMTNEVIKKEVEKYISPDIKAILFILNSSVI